MQDIISDAQTLGKKIATHPRCANFLAATQAVGKNEEAQGILRDFQELARRMQELQQANKPIEVEDKHKLTEYEQQVSGNDLLKDMLKTQTDYLELMNGVNSAIEQAIQAAAKES